MIETPAGVWSIGYGAIGAVVGVLLYLVYRAIISAVARGNNEPPPKERKNVHAILWAILGFAIGGFLYDPVQIGSACTAHSA